MHLGQYAEAKSLIGDALKDGESVEVIYNNDGLITLFTVLLVLIVVTYR